MTNAEHERIVAQNPRSTINSKEAAYYFKIFRQFHPQDSVLGSIGIWTGFDFAEEREKVMSPTNYRNGESGRYTEGSFWAGYERHGNVLVLATGAIPLADLNVILTALHKDVETP